MTESRGKSLRKSRTLFWEIPKKIQKIQKKSKNIQITFTFTNLRVHLPHCQSQKSQSWARLSRKKSQTSTKNSENPKRILNILTIQKQPKNPKNPVYKVCPIWERSFACTLHAYILREWRANASFDVHNLAILGHTACTTAWTLMLPKLVILDLQLKRQNKSS